MLDRQAGWSVSFAGCGFLGVYHIGAATCLQERAPHLIRDARRIYGASAGALTGAVLVAGGSLAEACADVLGLAKEARKRNLGPLHPSFNVMKIIRDGLYKNLPENTHQLISGKLCISLTRVSDGKNVLVSHFNSKDEVVQVLGEMCEQGYSDALRFLKENGILHDSVSVDLPLKKDDHQEHAQTADYNNKTGAANQDKKDMLEEEMFIDQLKLAPWPLDETIFENLPPRLRKALQEACKEKCGLCAQLSKFLPMRLMSYMMLPYTLPVESAYFVALRLVDWFPDIPDDVRWMQGQLFQIMNAVYSKARKRLLSIPSKESCESLRKSQSAPPNTSLHSSYCPPAISHSTTHLEEWLWDLPYCEDLARKEVAIGINESFDSSPFFINSEESGVEVDFDSSSEKSFQTACEDLA
ncbi:patatin-like phospholipase domain-containing protein 2 isoform X3 [Hemicordylus capensis]|uniref:patatin-like phospholipase domain-containing protein 2 isoform X3 n=1 Tax=Hemicordylus capensis TaxID=884348 RepID=UPI0023035892|nr:patatin-like phospholipase domain-containing protein 2 isoform X3 [Hemicordylus capensis]